MTLIEVMVALGIIGVVLTSMSVFFVRSPVLDNHYADRDDAVRVAATALERVRGIRPADVLAGRAQNAVTNQVKVRGVHAYLSDGRAVWDTAAAAAAGATAAVPTVAVPTSLNGVGYDQYWYVVRCWRASTTGGTCTAGAVHAAYADPGHAQWPDPQLPVGDHRARPVPGRRRGHSVRRGYVLMQACDATLPQQQFAYVPSMELALPSSRATANPLGMCLDTVKGATTTVIVPVVFRTCSQPLDSTTKAPARQLRTLSTNSAFAATDNSLITNGYCLQMQNPGVADTLIILKSGCGSGYNRTTTMMPETTVGAGAAGEATGQFVNYQQSGRCLDVTEGNPTYADRTDGYNYLIVWPCTQAPDPLTIAWSEKWAMTAGTGKVVTTRTAVDYCLKSPRSTAAQKYV
ncbi:hypothetical protein ACWKSP_15735 [Micromonosporaceae bacterium Da 78-11]